MQLYKWHMPNRPSLASQKRIWKRCKELGELPRVWPFKEYAEISQVWDGWILSTTKRPPNA